jgi:hypothetical protein
MKQRVLVFVVAALACAAVAQAQVRTGVRAGVSASPDQFFFGGHVETEPLVEQLSFRPNVEIGLGDDVTTVAFNVEFVYSIPLRQQPWRVYFGAGPAANLYSHDDDSSIHGGFNLLVGAQHSRGLFTELKVGVADSPELKFTVGYQFR